MKKFVGIRLAFIVLGLTSLIFGFQNCVQGRLDDFKKSEEGASTTKVPFAYSVNVDRFAYMSCNKMGNNFDKQTYFTFRVAAMGDRVGLSFSQEFKDYVRENVSTQAERVRALMVPPHNQGGQMIMSIRNYGAIKDKMIVGSNMDPSSSSELIWDDISSSELGDILYDLGPYETDRLSQWSGRQLVGSLRLNSSTSEPIHLINNSGGSGGNWGYLGINFRSSLSKTLEQVVGVSDLSEEDSHYAYGVGFTLFPEKAYKYEGALASNSNPTRTIKELYEYNLAKPGDSAPGFWNCAIDYQFRILPKSASAATYVAAGCADPSNDSNLSPRSATAENALRVADDILNKSMGGQFWKIDPNNRCIYPLTSLGACYSGNSNPSVEWDLFKPCGETGGPQCVHFLSVCERYYQ